MNAASDLLVTEEAPLLRARMLALLHRLRLRRVPLTAQDARSTRSYCTRVLAVDSGAPGLHLDALHPTPLTEPALGSQLRLRGRLDGGLLRFECQLTDFAIDDHGPVLRAMLPQAIELMEQRGARRLPMPSDLQAPTLAIEHARGQSVARLLDVSVSGAGALAPLDAAVPIGAHLHCRFEVPTTLRVVAEVRSRTTRGAWQRLGLRFSQLRREEEERLIGAILRLERRAIRRMPVHA